MKYVCQVCGYVYDPAENDGIPFEQLPSPTSPPRNNPAPSNPKGGPSASLFSCPPPPLRETLKGSR